MGPVRQQLAKSPIHARVVPFAIFVVLTACQGQLGEDSRYWLYVAKTFVGAWLIWEMRELVPEMRWAFSWEAVLVGIGVCIMWVGMDPLYPKFSKAGDPWNPHDRFGPQMAWAVIMVRILGSTFVVPPLEEVFYRSFLYRYFVKTDFEQMPFARMHWLSFVVTSAIFGFTHYEWLAGILCGFAYQWLVIRKNRLGDAMTAHAITNFLLGIWIIWKGAWHFW